MEIFDNTNTVDQPKRFCQPFTGIRVVDIASTSFKTFHFVSDETISDVGFSIFIRQKPCEEMVITTTNAPVDGRTSVSTNGKFIKIRAAKANLSQARTNILSQNFLTGAY